MVTHILKNGTKVDDITGHVVKVKDAPMTYEIIEKLNRERRNNNDDHLRGNQEGK